MRVTNVLATLLAVTSANAQYDALGLGPDASLDSYPVCPENYTAYCCMTIVPYTNKCSRGRCTQELGWSCVLGAKVDSMKECLKKVDGNKSAYCKRPGYEYFGSPLRWTGGSFSPMLEPSDYRHWLRPGMQKPWVPAYNEIRWEQDASKGDIDEAESGELRKRHVEDGDTDMA